MKTEHFFSKKNKKNKAQFDKVLVKICGANLGYTHPDEQFFGLNVAYQAKGKSAFQQVLNMEDSQALFDICEIKSERDLIDKQVYLFMDNLENIYGFAAV